MNALKTKWRLLVVSHLWVLKKLHNFFLDTANFVGKKTSYFIYSSEKHKEKFYSQSQVNY